MDVTGKLPLGFLTTGPGARVSRDYLIPEAFLRPRELAWQQSFDHPRRTMYQTPAALRAIAMALERPHLIICGLSALAIYGLPFFADCNDTTLYGPVRAGQRATQFTPLVLRRPPGRQWSVFFGDHALRVSPPVVAVVETLRLLRRNTYSWQVHPIAGFKEVEIRAIQLIDATRRHLGLTPAEIREAGRGRVDNRWLKKMCGLSSELADSPKETEMRLLISGLCAELGVELTEQVTLSYEGRIVTVFDLAIPEYHIALMYDGEHHLHRRQRDRDSRINIESALLGWTVIRVTAGSLTSIKDYVERAVGIARAKVRTATESGAAPEEERAGSGLA